MKVINIHHYGGIDQIPPNSIPICRPTEYGNPFSSRSGKYTKEEAVALHRVDLYKQLIEDPHYLSKLKRDLEGKDLACYCKNDRVLKVCHGDNYLHILLAELSSRNYDRSVKYYLLDDIRRVLNSIDIWIRLQCEEKDYLTLYTEIGDTKIEINEVIRLFKERETDPYLQCVWLSNMLIDLEYAHLETDIKMKLYRLDHCQWQGWRFMFRPEGRDHEPQPPQKNLKKPRKKTYDIPKSEHL